MSGFCSYSRTDPDGARPPVLGASRTRSGPVAARGFELSRSEARAAKAHAQMRTRQEASRGTPWDSPPRPRDSPLEGWRADDAMNRMNAKCKWPAREAEIFGSMGDAPINNSIYPQSAEPTVTVISVHHPPSRRRVIHKKRGLGQSPGCRGVEAVEPLSRRGLCRGLSRSVKADSTCDWCRGVEVCVEAVEAVSRLSRCRGCHGCRAVEG